MVGIQRDFDLVVSQFLIPGKCIHGARSPIGARACPRQRNAVDLDKVTSYSRYYHRNAGFPIRVNRLIEAEDSNE